MLDYADVTCGLCGNCTGCDCMANPPLSFCTCDEGCRADADVHFPDCPVEERLREEFGY